MVKKILIKLNIVRKWLRSFLTPPGLVTTLFHKKYYRYLEFGHFEKNQLNKTSWLGVRAIKPPSDFWVYQEIIWETKPDVIIECGTFEGGSAYFMASICDLMDHGRIITIDNTDSPLRPGHPRITYIKGSTISDETVANVRQLIKPGEKVMAILDSNHRKRYVLKELEIYGPMVSRDCYLIVEDTHLNGHPVESNYGPGPLEAVKEFMNPVRSLARAKGASPEDLGGATSNGMKNNAQFVIDKSREKFLFSFNRNGYLRRI